jgi:hypothetical protein
LQDYYTNVIANYTKLQSYSKPDSKHRSIQTKPTLQQGFRLQKKAPFSNQQKDPLITLLAPSYKKRNRRVKYNVMKINTLNPTTEDTN